MLIGLFTTIFSQNTAGFILAELSLILTLILIYRFTYHTFNRETALIAVALFSMNPVIFYVYGRLTSEILFLPFNFLIFTFLYYIYKNQTHLTNRDIFFLSFLGVLMYLTRVEGFVYLGIIFIILIKLRGFLRAMLFLVFTVVLLLPYGLFLKAGFGQFSVIPKITYNTRLNVITAKLISCAENEDFNINQIQEFAWYSYDPESNELYSENIMDDDYYINLKSASLSQVRQKNKLHDLVLLVQANLIEVVRNLIKSFAFPFVFFIAILMGVYFLFKKDRRFLSLVAFWNIGSFYFIISHVEYRFFYVMLPFFSFIAACGISSLFSQTRIKKLLCTAFLIIIMVNSIYYTYGYYQEQLRRERFYNVSQEVRALIHAGQKVCVRMPHIAFFGGYRFVKLPICSPNELSQYLQAKQTRYLMLGKEVFSTREDLKTIYLEKDKHFKLIGSYSFPEETFKVFRII
ncbi:MAG: glycosyltransferase family 39 protein [Calditrichales bacterium]|nr:glycosyltransferase family 39 protein [Calditrichales bacterium]